MWYFALPLAYSFWRNQMKLLYTNEAMGLFKFKYWQNNFPLWNCMFWCVSRHWIFQFVYWNLLSELPFAASIKSKGENKVLQNLSWIFELNSKPDYGSMASRGLLLVLFLQASQFPPRGSSAHIKRENNFYLVHLSVYNPCSLLMSNWINGSFICDEPYFWLGAEGREVSRQPRKRLRESLSWWTRKHFLEKDALFLLPKPIALPRPAQPSSVAWERRLLGICVGRWIPAQGSLLPHELGAPYPAYLATDQKTILVFSKDFSPPPTMFRILSSSLC